MQFIDTHIHLQDYKSNSTPQIIKQAEICDVNKFVCPSIVEADWKKIADLSQNFKSKIIPAFGLHPWYLEQAGSGWESRICQYFDTFPQALVGETGLDRLKSTPQSLQEDFFTIHIELAKKYNRPLIIHAVKVEEWLEKYWHDLPSKFVLHSFSGRTNFLKRAVAKGAYISLCKKIMRNSEAKEIIKQIPADKLLLESDGPYQSEPQDIRELLKEIALIRQEKEEDLSRQIYQNSEEFLHV